MQTECDNETPNVCTGNVSTKIQMFLKRGNTKKSDRRADLNLAKALVFREHCVCMGL